MECVLALGFFDGVHLGHRALIRLAVAKAKELGLPSLVYTFSTHPRAIFGVEPEMLMSAEEREVTLLALGIDKVVMAPFTAETAGMAPEAFMRGLVSKYGVRCVVVGKDYTFGRGAKGNVTMLQGLAREMGFSVLVVPDVYMDGEKISSSRIRRAINNGELALADRMLGKIE